MHTQDVSDDRDIATEIALTRSKTQANAAALALDLSLNEFMAAKETVATLPISKQPKPKQMTQPKTAYISLDAKLEDQPELDLARTFLHYNFPITLPPHFQPPSLTAPDGDMVVVGEKVMKMSKHKAVLLVRFVSPAAYVGHKIQLYPKSFEPSRGKGQGADFSLLSALKVSHPKAITLRHLGITEHGASSSTAALLLAFSEYTTADTFCAADIDDNGADQHGQQPSSELSPLHLRALSGEHPRRSTDPVGYVRSTPDPRHRGQAMRTMMHEEWRKAESTEMEGLIKRNVWTRVLRSTLTAF
jgi:hypothetical protein